MLKKTRDSTEWAVSAFKAWAKYRNNEIWTLDDEYPNVSDEYIVEWAVSLRLVLMIVYFLVENTTRPLSQRSTNHRDREKKKRKEC